MSSWKRNRPTDLRSRRHRPEEVAASPLARVRRLTWAAPARAPHAISVALAMLAAALVLPAAESDGTPSQPVPAKLPAPATASLTAPQSSSMLDEVFAQGFIVPPPKPDDNAWLEDPFKSIENEMGLVVFNLEKGNTSRPVEVEQPQLIERFDQLIELLEKARQSSGSGPASPSPDAPANASSLAAGPGGRGKMRDPGDGRKKWAQLTPKEREKILQSRAEGFPPGYEELLQDYFLRLSTEQASPTPAPPADASEPQPE